MDAAAKAAAAADAKAARREENQQTKREEALEKAAREQKRRRTRRRQRRGGRRSGRIEEAFQEAKARGRRQEGGRGGAGEGGGRGPTSGGEGGGAGQGRAVLSARARRREPADRTGAALLVSEARAVATSSAEVEIYQAAQLDLKLSETQGRKVSGTSFRSRRRPRRGVADRDAPALRRAAHVTASLLNRVGRARGVDRKQHRRATSLAAQEPAERCSMECPARRLIDTQYSCAAEGRTDQQPWQNALYRVNTLLLNHKTVDQVRIRVRVACAAGAESMAAARAIARNMCVASTPTPMWFGFGVGFGAWG